MTDPVSKTTADPLAALLRRHAADLERADWTTAPHDLREAADRLDRYEAGLREIRSKDRTGHTRRALGNVARRVLANG